MIGSPLVRLMFNHLCRDLIIELFPLKKLCCLVVLFLGMIFIIGMMGNDNADGKETNFMVGV